LLRIEMLTQNIHQY